MYPGCISLLSMWYTRKELGTRSAWFFSCATLVRETASSFFRSGFHFECRQAHFPDSSPLALQMPTFLRKFLPLELRGGEF